MAKEYSPINVTPEDLRLIPSSYDGSEHRGGILQVKKIRKKSLWNLFIFSLCYFLIYTGFWSLGNLESTMNSKGGIGDFSQEMIYISSMVSTLFLPKLFIDKFGCKKILIAASVVMTIFMASNMYIRPELLVSTSILYGLFNGPFMAAQTVYVDELATRFQATVTGNPEFVMACFFGLFAIFMESTQIWGNVIAYYALSYGRNETANSTAVGVDCGIHFKPGNDSNSNLDPPTQQQRMILVGSYTALAGLAVVILTCCLEPLRNDVKESHGCSSVLSRFLSTLTHLRTPQQILLVPLSIYVGMEGPFYGNEFTQAYIACSWGVHHVGFVTVCFGVCGAAMALLVGPLVKCVSQMAVLLLAAAANAVTCALLFFWTPSPDSVWEYFVFAGVWGMGDAIWWSQVTALYGLMFPNDREAAFSNLYFWSFLGFFLSYSYANYFSVAVKISILLGFLGVGIFGYLVGQIKLKCYSPRHEYLLISDEH